eukprot:10253468-Alexandrium_andersonii.AAC.1
MKKAARPCHLRATVAAPWSLPPASHCLASRFNDRRVADKDFSWSSKPGATARPPGVATWPHTGHPASVGKPGPRPR